MRFARALIAVAGTVILGVNAPHASGSAPISRSGPLCVGGAGCLRTTQAAVDAAPVGATIRIAAGTFAGRVTIDKSLRLAGAGAGRTVIRGGGPVLTISTRASGPPAVSISGVTVTGGTAHGDGVEAWGGGIFSTLGALVLTSSSVERNRAVPDSIGRFAEGGGIFMDSGAVTDPASAADARRRSMAGAVR